MTYPEFMTSLESHYGKYKSEITENMTLKFIKSVFSENELEALLFKVMAKYTNQFKTPPDIAKFYEIVQDGLEQRAESAWIKAQKGSGIDTVFFDDPIIHATIITMWGNWGAFSSVRCNKENITWTKKDFIKTYKMCCEFNSIEHKPMKGVYPDFQNKVKLIGDESKCIKMLENKDDKNKQLDMVDNMFIRVEDLNE